MLKVSMYYRGLTIFILLDTGEIKNREFGFGLQAYNLFGKTSSYERTGKI